MSHLDPDTFGILCRNPIENALRLGDREVPVEVTRPVSGAFIVANDGPSVPPEMQQPLTEHFHRAKAATHGSGPGLANVAAMAERIERPLTLALPHPGSRPVSRQARNGRSSRQRGPLPSARSSATLQA